MSDLPFIVELYGPVLIEQRRSLRTAKRFLRFWIPLLTFDLAMAVFDASTGQWLWAAVMLVLAATAGAYIALNRKDIRDTTARIEQYEQVIRDAR